MKLIKATLKLDERGWYKSVTEIEAQETEKLYKFDNFLPMFPYEKQLKKEMLGVPRTAITESHKLFSGYVFCVADEEDRAFQILQEYVECKYRRVRDEFQAVVKAYSTPQPEVDRFIVTEEGRQPREKH